MKQRVYRVGRIRLLKPEVDVNEYLTKYPDAIKVRMPSQRQLEVWSYDSICESIDGCTVEPDGECEHGFPSWLIALGLI